MKIGKTWKRSAKAVGSDHWDKTVENRKKAEIIIVKRTAPGD